MIRMELALFLVLGFIALMYFTAEKKLTRLHKTYSYMLIAMLFNIAFDGITVYTVNHMDSVPPLINDLAHRFFIGFMVLVVYLFYRYMVIMVEEETGRTEKLTLPSRIVLIAAEICALVLPLHYTETPLGNYSDGIHVIVCYIAIIFYFLLGAGLFIANYKKLDSKRVLAISVALVFEAIFTVIQAIQPTWLLSGIGLTLITLAFYLTLESPDLLRAELDEQKMSMLYLKSQVNPHFLYNTVDTIRIQAQLNGDNETAHLLMRLVDFFRLSVKVNHQLVELDDELDLSEAYLDLMCCRYPELTIDYDIEPGLEEVIIPNFILQPIVENCLKHGLKNKGYKGEITITAKSITENAFVLEVSDTGSGFAEGRKAEIDELLRTYDKHAPKLEGNSIGLLNVQKRIKYLCGPEYGLSYTENETPEGGVTAHIRLPLKLKSNE